MINFRYIILLFANKQWGTINGGTNQIGIGFPIAFSSTDSVYATIISIQSKEYNSTLVTMLKTWSETWIQFWRSSTSGENPIFFISIGK